MITTEDILNMNFYKKEKSLLKYFKRDFSFIKF